MGGYLVLIGVLALVLAGTFTRGWSDNLSVESNQDNVSYQETQIITTRVLHPSPEASLTSQPTLTASPTTTPSPTSKLTATPRPTITPTSTQTPLPPIAWDTPPPCDILQKDAADWHQFVVASSDDPIADGQLTAYLRQVQAMSFVLDDLSRGDLLMIFNTPNNAAGIEVAQRELMTLWLNVVSGQLNRATEVDFSGLPEIGTVGELLTYLEENLAKGQVSEVLLEASQMLLKNEGISLRVCDNLLYLQVGNKIEQTLLTVEGLITRPVSLSYNKDDFGWIMSHMVPSPDYRLVAIETGAYESGGPVHIWDRQTGELLNLNDQLNSVSTTENKFVFSYGGLGRWEVIGWHPNSQRLLIGKDLTGIVYWIDLQSYTYQQIPLGGNGAGGRTIVDLAPDGNGFVYIKYGKGMDTKTTFNFYDLNSNEVAPIFTPSDGDGYPQFPSFSPTREAIAYVANQKGTSAGMIRAIRVLDLNTGTSTTLFEGYLRGGESVVWSSNGQKIAFHKEDPDGPYAYISSVGKLHGNIWVASVPNGEVQQVTFIQGGAFRPVWDPDGQTLAFQIYDGQVGLTSLDNPDQIWYATTTSPNWPLFTSVHFLP